MILQSIPLPFSLVNTKGKTTKVLSSFRKIFKTINFYLGYANISLKTFNCYIILLRYKICLCLSLVSRSKRRVFSFGCSNILFGRQLKKVRVELLFRRHFMISNPPQQQLAHPLCSFMPNYVPAAVWFRPQS